MNFSIRLNAPTGTAVTASYSTTNGTAIAGTDYQTAVGTVTIPAGSTTAQVPVTELSNSTAQPNRTGWVSAGLQRSARPRVAETSADVGVWG